MPVKTAPSRRAFSFIEIKAFDEEQGLFEGYLSVFGNADSYKDVVDHGAFTKTLQEAELSRKSRGTQYLFPILWQHAPSDPVGGFIEARETERGLYVKGQLDLDIEQGKRAYSGLKKGYLNGLSIGYDTIKHEYKDGLRHLKEIRLWEGSLVTFGANDLALVAYVKSANHNEYVADVEYDFSLVDEEVEETKTACGKTSWPIAAKETTWDGGAAKKQLKDWANGSTAKLKQVYMWTDGKNFKFPFCHIEDGKPVAVPKAIFSIASSIDGGRGGAKIGNDAGGIKSKVSKYYARMRKQFKDDSIIPPWEKKSFGYQLQKARSFSDVMDDRAEMNAADDFYELMSAMTCSIFEIMNDDDEDNKAAAVQETLNQFAAAVMQWENDAEDVFEDDDDTNGGQLVGYSGYMAADFTARQVKSLIHEVKAGRAISAENASKISKTIKTISTALHELSALVGPDPEPDDAEDTDQDASKTGDSKAAELEETAELEGPAFLKLLAEATLTQCSSPSQSEPPETKSASTTSDIDDDALRLMELVKQISQEVQRSVA